MIHILCLGVFTRLDVLGERRCSFVFSHNKCIGTFAELINSHCQSTTYFYYQILNDLIYNKKTESISFISITFCHVSQKWENKVFRCHHGWKAGRLSRWNEENRSWDQENLNQLLQGTQITTLNNIVKQQQQQQKLYVPEYTKANFHHNSPWG